MNEKEQIELEELRAFKRAYDLRPLEAAFEQLDRVLKRPNSYAFDAVMPVAAYRILAEAVITLKDEVMSRQ